MIALAAIERQEVPAILNLDNPDPVGLNYITKKQALKVNTIIKNSLAFGSINSSIVLKKYE